MQSKPIIALDFSTSEEIKQFLAHFKEEQLFV
ncbi:orotidine-5'-phosphate decarboxylase, partial [Carnobacterium maltaromaticum]